MDVWQLIDAHQFGFWCFVFVMVGLIDRVFYRICLAFGRGQEEEEDA